MKEDIHMMRYGIRDVATVSLVDTKTGEVLCNMGEVQVAKIKPTQEPEQKSTLNFNQPITFELTDFKINMVWVYQMLGFSKSDAKLMNRLSRVKMKTRSSKEKVRAEKRINKLKLKYKMRLT
jgi:hypothetical protein